MIDPLPELSTEQSDPRYSQIDRLPTSEIAQLMNQADATVPTAVGGRPARHHRGDRRDLGPHGGGRTAALRRRGHLGPPGRPRRLGVPAPPSAPDPSLVQGVIAGGLPALTRSVEGAEDDTSAGEEALAERGVGALDSVVGISASGRAPFVLGALAEAGRRGALTVALSCNHRTPLSAAAGHAIEVVVGPEVVTGSTRLKAGTAQKLVLT
ncbi:hypothetical protein [Nonomuraea dietziae]|uniref:hypothetical protein n=1 Tax=Nonomuraea dietziae TaxID=65515 RepID=UPI0031DC2D30